MQKRTPVRKIDDRMAVYMCNLRMYRMEQCLSQEELADEIGVSRQTICLIETQKIIPSIEIAVAISRALEQSVERIFVFTSANDKRSKAIHNIAKLQRKHVSRSRNVIMDEDQE